MQAIPARDGLILPIFNGTSTLLNTAEHFVECGYSVIPLYGNLDSNSAKVAAVAWTEFQHRQPTEAELRYWFTEQRYPGLAIVTGSVSQLAVLDCDVLLAFTRFCHRLPDLIDTHTVKTRRGWHLYFRLPPGLSLPSLKGQGVDLLSDGKYVVAPPTSVNGWTYKVSRNVEPRTLNESDTAGILAFFGTAATPTPQPRAAPEFTPFIRDSEGNNQNCRTASTRLLIDYDLISRYKYRVNRDGRNEALFQASLFARDQGWHVEDVLACLVDVHVRQPAGRSHRPESDTQRRREAIATIRSAFSRPARPCRQRAHYNNEQLPNRVRERLLQMGQTCVVRVLEGLRLTGIEPGQEFVIGEALQKLKGRVGRDSIYQALKATTPDGQPIFDSLPPDPPTLAHTDTKTQQPHNNKCFVVIPQIPGKNKRGRPAQVFVMPGNLDLCRKLGVKPSVSDPITVEDLQTAKQTRQAVHRELIRRRPGQYPCQWLARRLGVCLRTIHAYNREIPIGVQAIYAEMPVTWSMLHRIPDDFEVPGTFLEDEAGERYPARRDIAMRLLSKGRYVTHKRREANYYWFGDISQNRTIRPGLHRNTQVQIVRQHENGAQQHPQSRLPAPMLTVYADDLPKNTSPHTLPLSNAPTTPPVSEERTRQATKPKSKRFFRRPLADERMEQLAKQVHAQTNPSLHGNPDGLSIFNARRLVDTYGVGPVEAALKRMGWLRDRGKLTSAAGFMITVSRIEWRKQNGATDLGSPAPRFQAEPTRKGRSTYRKSSKDALMKSEAWLCWRAQFAEEQGDWDDAAFWRSKIKREIPF